MVKADTQEGDLQLYKLVLHISQKESGPGPGICAENKHFGKHSGVGVSSWDFAGWIVFQKYQV